LIGGVARASHPDAGVLRLPDLFTADTLLVKTYFSEADADFYVSAGTLSRALMWLVLPCVPLCFRSWSIALRSRKKQFDGRGVFGTALLAVAGAAGLSVLGPLS
jgi:hypothetical protein